MKNILGLIIIVLFLINCSETAKSGQRQMDFPQNIAEDTSKNNSGKKDSIVIQNTDSLESFLQNPIHLKTFKKIKVSSNTSIKRGKYTEGLKKPDYEGFYMLFFLIEGEHGVHFLSYRKGKNYGFYGEDRDELIQLYSDRADKDLGNADLVGKKVTEIENVFGKNYISENEFRYYYNSTGAVLMLHITTANTVDFFRLSYLSKPIRSLQDIPEAAKRKGW